jgi:hypothetical protein
MNASRPIRIALALAPLAVLAFGLPVCAGAGGGPQEPVARAPTADLLAATTGAPARPPSDLPLAHWAYALLERLVARRVLEIDLSTRPVSRAAVARALLSVPDASEGEWRRAKLTERERWALDRLRAEFLDGSIDTPIVSLRDGGSAVALGVVLGTEVRYAEGRGSGGDSSGDPVARRGDERVSAMEGISYEAWGGAGRALGFYSDARILLVGQDGPRTARLSRRARTWRGAVVTIDRAYVKLERPHVSLALGRRGPAWGRSERGRLLLSGAAPTLDQIDGSLEVGPFAFHAFHAMLEYEETGGEAALEPSDQVFLAGHRVVLSGRSGGLGLSEVVVYSSTVPDPAYLNPLLPYYVSQHNERANDNVLWSADFTWRPARGLELYGEFLVDDLQYDRNTGYPDKYGLTLGQAFCSHALGFDYEIVAEYSQARKWVYTHKRVEHRYAHDGRPIGFELGPDADRAIVEATIHPSPAWSLTVGYEHSRMGEGTITEAFEEGEESGPAFPSGGVLVVRRAALEVVYDSLAGFSYGLGASYDGRSKEGDGSGEVEDGWEVWIGAEFRI